MFVLPLARARFPVLNSAPFARLHTLASFLFKQKPAKQATPAVYEDDVEVRDSDSDEFGNGDIPGIV